MFTIAGTTGNVGSATARQLLHDGEDVTVVVRDPARGRPWAERGAAVAVADLTDRSALAAALRDSDGLFTLLPFSPGALSIDADQEALIDGIAGAVADSGVPHVAVLSSLGADLDDPPQILRWLQRFERRLAGTAAAVSAVRSTHFQEKVRDLLGPARDEGVYPVFGRADVPVPMVAARDVGATAAQTLRSRPERGQIIDVLGPAYSEQQVAEQLAAALGRPLEVVTVPRAAWTDTLAATGLPLRAAELLAGLYEAGDAGRLAPAGDRQVRGTTPIEETLGAVLQPVS